MTAKTGKRNSIADFPDGRPGFSNCSSAGIDQASLSTRGAATRLSQGGSFLRRPNAHSDEAEHLEPTWIVLRLCSRLPSFGPAQPGNVYPSCPGAYSFRQGYVLLIRARLLVFERRPAASLRPRRRAGTSRHPAPPPISEASQGSERCARFPLARRSTAASLCAFRCRPGRSSLPCAVREAFVRFPCEGDTRSAAGLQVRT